ncbi:MAG: PIG-L deacetylase family protein [bacterium]
MFMLSYLEKRFVKKRSCSARLLLLALITVPLLATAERLSSGPVTLCNTDRILILAPHPDDEVIGCGGVIQQSVAMKLPVRVVYFTYGDNNEWSFLIYRKHAVLAPGAVKQMGLIRHNEAVVAAETLGLSTNQLTFLGYPDFGTLRIWINHWGDSPPAEGMMTHATAVPYANALRPGAPYRGEEIVKDLTSVIRAFMPTKICVSHPADFNVDHRALYCFTQLTLWNLESEIRPEVFPYMVHFPRWPNPRGNHPGLPLKPPAFFEDDIAWRDFRLTPELIAGKEKALRAHRSQFEYAAHYLESFMRTNELFGDFERIVFPAPITTRSKVSLLPTAPPRPDERDEENHLTESERNGFVGLEWRHIQLETNAVKLSINLSRPLGEAVSAAIQVFGYRHDVPFELMPKIRVEIGLLGNTVHNQNLSLPTNRIRVLHHMRDIEAEIPLDLLGCPERLFVCARTYLGEIPLDWVSWRLVELK